MRKIAILTSGGDAPGMNTAVRAVVKTAKSHGYDAYLVYEGYKGLYENQIVSADTVDVDKYASYGGTLIYSARFPEFKEEKIRNVAIENLKKHGIDALVVIGGDGSYMGAQKLHEAGVKTIGLPGTIDNDIKSSDFTIGYDTALNTVVEAIDRIRDTAASHRRIMIVEIMGNQCGDLAMYSGLATGAEIILTSEYKPEMSEVIKTVKELTKQPNRRSIIIAVSEKCYDIKQMQEEVERATGWTTRSNPLNHIQRGGRPSAQERILSTLLGIKAVEFLKEGRSGIAIGIKNNDIIATPILEALKMPGQAKEKTIAKVIKFNKLNQQN